MKEIDYDKYFQEVMDEPIDRDSVKERLAEIERDQLKDLLLNMASRAIATQE